METDIKQPPCAATHVMVSKAALHLALNALERDAKTGKAPRGEIAEALRASAMPLAEYPREADSETILVQEAWEAAGGNPGIKASREELLAALRVLDEVCDEADSGSSGTNTPIEDLMRQFAEEGCDFTDVAWVRKVALRYVQTLPDSQSRCLLYALATRITQA